MQNIKVFKLCFDRYLDKSVSFGAVSEDSASQWPIEYFQFSLIDPKSKLYCLCLCHECVRSRVTTNHRIVYRINHWALSCNHIWFSNCKLIAALRWVIVRTHRNRFSLSTASSYFHAAVSYSLCSIGLSSSTMEIHVWSNGMQIIWKYEESQLVKLVDELGTINRRASSVHPIIITALREPPSRHLISKFLQESKFGWNKILLQLFLHLFE